MEKQYQDFTTACHKKANELNKSHLHHLSMFHIAKKLGIEWETAWGWVKGEVV